MGAGAIVIKYYLLPSGRGGVGPKKQFEMTGDLGKIAHQ